MFFDILRSGQVRYYYRKDCSYIGMVRLFRAYSNSSFCCRNIIDFSLSINKISPAFWFSNLRSFRNRVVFPLHLKYKQRCRISLFNSKLYIIWCVPEVSRIVYRYFSFRHAFIFTSFPCCLSCERFSVQYFLKSVQQPRSILGLTILLQMLLSSRWCCSLTYIKHGDFQW